MHTATRPAGYAHREVTQPPNWHGLVVWDVFFNALATGLFMAAAVGQLAAPGVFGPVAAWAYPLALVLLLTDLSLLVLDLGDPLRFHHMLRVFKPLSPMSLGTWCLTAFSLPLTLLAALDVLVLLGWLPGDSAALGWVRTVLLVVGLPFAFGSAAYKGVLFSTTAQPGWRDARWLGAYHTGGAVAAGAALLLVLAALTGHDRAAAALRPALVVLLLLHAVPMALVAVELRPALAARYTRGELTRDAVVVGGVGVLVPLLVLSVGSGSVAAVVVAACVLLGSWVARHRIVMLPHHGGHHTG